MLFGNFILLIIWITHWKSFITARITAPISTQGLVFQSLAKPGASFVPLSNWLPSVASSPSKDYWSLSFDFRTNQSNGLIFYSAPDLHQNDEEDARKPYLQISLIEHGQLEIRFQHRHWATTNNYNAPTDEQRNLLINIGRDLNDDKWHHVIIDNWESQFSVKIVDGRHGKVKHVEQRSLRPNFVMSSDFKLPWKVFLFGKPPTKDTRELPSTFRGLIRSFNYRTSKGKQKFPRVLKMERVEVTQGEQFCQQGKLSKPVFLDAMTSFSIPVATPESSSAYSKLKTVKLKKNEAGSSERLSIQFATYSPAGVIMTSTRRNHLLHTLALQDGFLKLAIWCPEQSLERLFHNGNGGSFFDYQTHTVTIDLDKEEHSVSLKIDGVLRLHEVLPEECRGAMKSASEIVLAASFGEMQLPYFHGLLHQATLVRDMAEWDLLQGRKIHKSLEKRTEDWIPIGCFNATGFPPTTSTTKSVLCKSASAILSSKSLESVSFQLKTKDPHGLVMFQATGKEFLSALDVFDGLLSVIFRRPDDSQKGFRSIKFTMPDMLVNSGRWHNVTLLVIGDQVVKFKVDDLEMDFLIGLSASSSPKPDLFFGNVISSAISNASMYSELYSTQKNVSFRSCIRNLIVNGAVVPLTEDEPTASKKRRTVLRSGPRRSCEDDPCLHGGVCRDSWEGFVCDCVGTGYCGATCQNEASKMDFDGSISKRVDLVDAVYGRQLTDVAFRFRTNQTDAVLLEAFCATSNDTVTFQLKSSRVVASINRDPVHTPAELQIGESLADGKWHSVIFSRKGATIELALDRFPLIETFPSLDSTELCLCSVQIGSFSTSKHNVSGHNSTGFIGTLQQVLFDGQDLLRPSSRYSTEPSSNASYYFSNASHYIRATQPKFSNRIDIRFFIRATQKNGLVFYNGQPGADFIALEILHGKVHYVAQYGDAMVFGRSKGSVSDGEWHLVRVYRSGKKQHWLCVDDEKVAIGGKNQTKGSLQAEFYIGSLPQSLFSKLHRTLRSQNGFVGCIAELEINRSPIDLLINATEKHGQIVKGCQARNQTTVCQTDGGLKCQNGGICTNRFGEVECDCDMTSFTGELCAEYSVTFRFGPLPGMVIYHFDNANRPDSRTDEITFGIVTLEDEAILAYISSFTSEDSTEIQLVGGHIFVIYNMGTQAHLISDLKHTVNDGRYHVVKFHRNGPNATLQIDSNPLNYKIPAGRQLDVFNDISTIEIGGKLNTKTQQMERTFDGLISGFTLNGIRVLDLAADSDANILVEGYPEQVADRKAAIDSFSVTSEILKSSPNWINEMQLTQTTSSAAMDDQTSTKQSDDLFTIVDSGICPEEDAGCALVDSSTTDELIFAQYTVVKSTTPLPKSTKTTPNSPDATSTIATSPCDNDDEDCDIESSGDSNVSSNMHSARSAALPFPRTTRPPIVINVTFTSLFSSSSILPVLTPRSSSTSRPLSNVISAPSIPTSTTGSATNMEHIAIVAGGAIALLIVIAMIVLIMLRKKDPDAADGVANAEKTYENFTRPEPNSATTTVRRNGETVVDKNYPANVAAAMGTFQKNGKSKEREHYV